MGTTNDRENGWPADLLGTAAVGALCLLALLLYLKLPADALGIPFAYSGDTVWMAATVKGMKENGWFFVNRFMGMPGIQDMRDYPVFDIFNQLLLKLISLFTGSPVKAMNVFYLASFPLSAMSAFIALRGMKLGLYMSAAAALLFSFLPYHFIRYQHLFLSAYFMVPPIILAIWRTFSEDPARPAGKKSFYVSCVIAFVTGCAGIYYAYFACVFICLAAAWKFLRYREIKAAVPFAVLLGCIMTAGLLQSLPVYMYRHANGANSLAVERVSIGTEVYGLRIMQMLVPVEGHRLGKLGMLNRKYSERTPVINENRSAVLGTFGSAGFLLLTLLFFHMAMTRGASAPATAMEFSSVLTVAAVLFATMGGFGTLVAFLPIRGYNRISVFIAYFSLFAAFFFIENLCRRTGSLSRSRALLPLLAFLLMIAGLYDLTSRALRPDWKALEAAWNNDKLFVEGVEAVLPAHAMVFQLPYMPFPESAPVVAMGDYELMKPYLHSKSLRWSYGAVKGRAASAWQKETAELAPEAMLSELRAKGFAAVYINRTGFADRAAGLETALSGLLKKKPLISSDGQLSFFSL